MIKNLTFMELYSISSENWKDLSIGATFEDYDKLSRFHYKTKRENESESLWIKDCHKLLFDDKLIGVIVYSHPYLNSKPRNTVLGERYVYSARAPIALFNWQHLCFINSIDSNLLDHSRQLLR